MSNWYSQGRLVDSIPVDDRAAQYGDGLFETVAIRDGQPRFWESHVERLTLGCKRLGLNAPPDQLLQSELRSALGSSDIDSRHAIAKLVVSAGAGPRGYQRLEKDHAIIRIGLFESKVLPAEIYRAGVAVRICQTRLAIQPGLAGIKSLNRLEQVLARAEWREPSIFEGLMLDTDDRLICGTMSNVFCCSENSIVTPAITRCGIAGIMRQQLIAELAREGRAVEVCDLGVADLLNADEVFVSNSQFGVLPVRRVDFTDFSPGTATQEVMRLLARVGVEECLI